MPSMTMQAVFFRADSGDPLLVPMLLDTGASESFIDRQIAEQLTTVMPMRPRVFTLGDNREMSVDGAVTLDFDLEGRRMLDTFLVREGGAGEAILGLGSMSKFGMTLAMGQSGVFLMIGEQKKEGVTEVTQEAAKGVTKESAKKLDNTKEKIPMVSELLKRLLARIGMMDISDDLTDDDAMSMIVDRCRGMYSMVASEGVLTALGLPKEADESQVRGTILALKNPGNVVSVAEHEAALAERDELLKNAYFAQAKIDGKITPADEKNDKIMTMFKDEFPVFKAFIEHRGVQAPLRQSLPAGASLVAAPEQDKQTQSLMSIYAHRRNQKRAA